MWPRKPNLTPILKRNKTTVLKIYFLIFKQIKIHMVPNYGPNGSALPSNFVLNFKT